MTVVFEKMDDWYSPRTICDACQQPITDIHNAMAVYEESAPDDDAVLTRVFHAHKDDECQASVRQSAAHKDANGMWEEMSRHLVMVAVNMGMFPIDFAKRYDSLLARGRVPPPRDE